jgi:hypothetical protein
LVNRGLSLIAALALASAAIACAPPSSTTSPPTPSAIPASAGTETVAPSLSVTEAPSRSPWSTGALDKSTTTPALEFRSTGTKLIWSSGARADHSADVAPDLFAARPGGKAALLYDNPNRDSRLEYIDGVGDRVAFMELNDRIFGAGGWKLWYMPEPSAKPVLIDSGAGGQLPFFALSDRHLVWTIITGNPEMSELREIELGSMSRHVLASDRADHTQYWFPDIDGSRLVYGTVEPSADLSTDERHIYLLDLETGAPSRRLDKSTSASEPAIHGTEVVWKESDPTLNFLVAGDLVHDSLLTDTIQPLKLPAPSGTGFTDPSVGDRYVAAWPESDRMLYVADLQSGDYPAILDLGATTADPHDAVGHADISGDLLAYIYAPASGDLELRWVLLQ